MQRSILSEEKRPAWVEGVIEEQAKAHPRVSWWIDSQEGVPSSDLCFVCRQINFKILLSDAVNANKLDTSNVSLGSLSRIISNTSCPFCSLAARSVIPQVDGQSTKNISSIHLELRSIITYSAGLEQGRPIEYPMLQVLPVSSQPKTSTARGSGSTQALNSGSLCEGKSISAQFNVSLSQRWLRLCEGSHIESHWSLETRATPGDSEFRLIDVKRQCIVMANKHMRYLALSYVWGNVQQLRNLKGLCEALEKDGGLSSQDEHLPQVIKDAMSLVIDLEERYLWVDSLCIIHDDSLNKHNQLAAMDSVYSSALLTIVAAAGKDATIGLSGVTIPRGSSQLQAEKVQDISLVGQPPSMAEGVDATTWNGRAWTLQERLLARRMLIFTEQRAYFQCCHGYRWEEGMSTCSDFKPKTTPKRPRANPNALDLWGGPSAKSPVSYTTPDLYGLNPQRRIGYDSYWSAVKWYTQRHMSYESDGLDAFTGLLMFLHQQMETKFLFGLPETELDLAILWQPYGSLRRRKDPRTSQPLFPSWSWAGWVGGVKHQDMFDDMQSLSRITWIDALADPSSPKYFTSDEYRAAAGDHIDKEEPWHRAHNYFLDDEKSEMRYYFFQASRPDTWFLHPTAPEASRRPRSRLKHGTHQLQFLALTAFFSIKGEPVPFATYEGPSGQYRLYFLEIHNELDDAVGRINLSEEIASTVQPGTHEFVRLSRTGQDLLAENPPAPYQDFEDVPKSRQSFPDQVQNISQIHTGVNWQRYNLKKPWCLFNVMMIQRQEEVAYRVGVGKIHVDAFMQAKPEQKVILLG
ncbi:hypothetical protein MMC12_006183 [Toensbergia leucococca]|nr:hypothetical protein [Toensbergia leucococca]